MNNKPSITPFGLRHDPAAHFVGVGTTKFDEMVADGRMPLPRCADGCQIWIRPELETAVENLPIRDDGKSDNQWDGI